MTRKTSTYARKRALRLRAETKQKIIDEMLADVRRLQDNAGIHAWIGNDGAKLANCAGRIVYMTAHSVASEGIDIDDPDVRILRGTAEALGDLAADLEHVDRYRPSICSGMAAITRLINRCNPLHMLLAAQDLNDRLHSTGITTYAIQDALEGLEQKATA